MTLYCVRDGDSANDAKGWNTPLKKVEPVVTHDPKAKYIPTPTPGVVIDSQTGRMETQIPENENANRLGGGAKHYLPKPSTKLAEIQTEQGKITLYTGKRPDLLIMDDIKDRSEDPQDFSSWYNSSEVQAFLANKNGYFR